MNELPIEYPMELLYRGHTWVPLCDAQGCELLGDNGTLPEGETICARYLCTTHMLEERGLTLEDLQS